MPPTRAELVVHCVASKRLPIGSRVNLKALRRATNGRCSIIKNFIACNVNRSEVGAGSERVGHEMPFVVGSPTLAQDSVIVNLIVKKSM